MLPGTLPGKPFQLDSEQKRPKEPETNCPDAENLDETAPGGVSRAPMNWIAAFSSPTLHHGTPSRALQAGEREEQLPCSDAPINWTGKRRKDMWHISRVVLALVMVTAIVPGGAAAAEPANDEKSAQPPSKSRSGALQAQLKAADQILAPLAKVGKVISAMNRGADHRSAIKQALAGVSQIQSQLPGLKAAFAEAERTVGSRGGEEAVASLETLLAKLMRELKEAEGEDKLEFSEIQELMSAYNQAEQMASNVLKKHDDTNNAISGKT